MKHAATAIHRLLLFGLCLGLTCAAHGVTETADLGPLGEILSRDRVPAP